ncbi:hypothetical protein DH2020_018279 [Rehmannia glutinosa]|uniref:Uncharacterized protein n=1 Tax=Rehmannia glutinosa TaxID=99300 RepID=A0ABR0WIU8_REHGL
MYNSVRRFGNVKYDTLRLPHKVVAEEADGSVKFGQGEGSAYLFDPDIYTDGRISVQGIDGVLFPAEESKVAPKAAPVAKIVSKPRRVGERLVSDGVGTRNNLLIESSIRKLLEMACTMLGAVGHDSHFSSCH